MLASISPENEVSQSKIITVYSNKGGIGKTTIAVNLAAELAKVTKDKVALVDLNLQLGDISTFLNLYYETASEELELTRSNTKLGVTLDLICSKCNGFSFSRILTEEEEILFIL